MENVCKNQKIEILSRKKVFIIIIRQSFKHKHKQSNPSKAIHYKKMSSYKKTSAKPYCKVCHDAGKPENVYTSHFVKDKQGPEGKVACPYLLSLTCTYCKKKEGHTAKHCPNLHAQAKQQQHTQVQVQVQAKQQPQPQVQATTHRPVPKDDDGWLRVGKKALVVVVLEKKEEEPEKKVVVPKKESLMTAFIEEDEKKDEEKEKTRIQEERKRIQFESEFPSLPKKQKIVREMPSPIEKAPEVIEKASEVVEKAPEVVEKAPEVAVDASYKYNFSGGSWADYDD